LEIERKNLDLGLRRLDLFDVIVTQHGSDSWLTCSSVRDDLDASICLLHLVMSHHLSILEFLLVVGDVSCVMRLRDAVVVLVGLHG